MKCYLMIEDTPSGIAFAADWGVPVEDLPHDVNDLTEAQYSVHRFMVVLRGSENPIELAKAQAESRTKIVLPFEG